MFKERRSAFQGDPKGRAVLYSLVQLLLDKNVISNDEVDELNQIGALVKTLVNKRIIAESEIQELVVGYRDLLRALVAILRDPLQRAPRVEYLRKKYGEKYSKVIDFILELDNDENQRRSETGSDPVRE